jgi:hypothetical protein
MEKIIIRKEEVQSRKSEELYYEAITAIENFRSMFEYSRLASLLLQDYRAHGLRREQRHEEIFSEVLTHSAMKADTGSLCSRALESYYRINELISDSKGDLNGVLKALEKRFRVVKSNPGPFKDYVINYNNDILVSIIYTNLNLGNIQEAQEFIKLFERSGLKSNTEKASYEIMSAQVNFLTCLKTNKVKSAAALVPVLENILKSYENKLLIDTELSIRFNIVKCRMLEKNYNSALSSINTLLAHPFIDKRGDYELYLRLMNLIIHYELNNFSLLRYLIKSVYRFLFKRKKLYRLESLIIDFIKKLPEVKNESDLEYSLIRAKNELLELKEDDYERNAFEYFDFLRWVEEKLS